MKTKSIETTNITWGEFKKLVEDLGVKNETKILYIDFDEMPSEITLTDLGLVVI